MLGADCEGFYLLGHKTLQSRESRALLAACILLFLCLIFHPDVGGYMLFRNAG
jgi:hypothetical protein